MALSASLPARVIRWSIAAVLVLAACGKSAGPPSDAGLPLMSGSTREIDFWTDEGTEMSVAVSPDGSEILFDLLGHVYRLPIAGGDAVAVTQNSGPALNFHPAWSADGKRIAFISDRGGQNNVWVMNADGTDPRPVLPDPETRFTSPAWAPDGRTIVAVRAFPTPGRGWHRQTTELWELPVDGGEPRRLLGGRLSQYDGPAFSADGRFLYFHVSYSTGEGLGLVTAGHRLQRLERATGQVTNVRTTDPAEPSAEYLAALKNTGYAADVALDPPAAVMAAPSPDGTTLAFALEETDSIFEYGPHRFRPRTGLYLRALATGVERQLLAPITKDLSQINAQYGYRVVPAHSWTPDGAVVVSSLGKLVRVDARTGERTPIPFRARVQRTLAEQPRSLPVISDSGFEVRFIQWPAGSPDGKRLAFVAVGRVWVMDLPDGAPRPLTDSMAGTIQLTPSWSPDGSEVAFTTWHDRDRGHLWRAPAAGGAPIRVSTDPGEYFGPRWSDDGGRIIVTMQTGPLEWNPWARPSGWAATAFPVAGGPPVQVAALGELAAVHPVSGGVSWQYQEDRRLAAGVYIPYPPDSVLRQQIRVRLASPADRTARDIARFPARRDRGAEPAVSPDGKWIAFQADRLIYLSRMPASTADTTPFFDTDPNHEVAGRTLVGRIGGVYHSWRDARTLQFASGNQYLTWDAETGTLTRAAVRLRIPRPKAGGTIALVGAKIVTADSGRVIDRGTVLVRGTRIVCVGECDPAGADTTIDVTGKVIIPGLVDVHAHHLGDPGGIVTPRRSGSALDMAYGVTSTVDPSATSLSLFPLAEMIDAGAVLGPRTFGTAELVITPGHGFGDNLVIRNLDDARYQVNRRADWGAISIKNFRQARREQNRLLIEAARERGITITGEGGPLFFDVGSTIDGQTGWEHMIASLPIFSDAAQFFGRAGMSYSPTVIVAGHVHGSKEYFRHTQGLLTDPKYNRFVPRATLLRQHAADRLIPKHDFSFPLIADGLAKIVRAGGYGAIGDHGEQPGIGSHWEIWAYAEALTPLEAITVATIHGARFVGLDRELGSITVGKLADLVILDRDPLADIRNTAAIRWVMKGGRLYDDETLDEVWPTARRFGPAPWQGESGR